MSFKYEPASEPLHISVYMIQKAMDGVLALNWPLKVCPSMIDSGLEGCRESRRCSRDTYPESYITKNTSIRSQSTN